MYFAYRMDVNWGVGRGQTVVSFKMFPPPQKNHVHLETQNGTLFGNSVSADISSQGSHEIALHLGQVLNPMTGILRRSAADAETGGKEGGMITEVEVSN